MSIKITVSLIVVATVMAFMLGYNVSEKTGVEPGFFEIAEAGGYGAGTEKKAPEGLSTDLQEYYDSLAKE